MEKDSLDHKTVTLLRRSGEQQGGLIPVVKDQYGNIISGRHRKAANPNWRETTIEVKDDLDRLLKIIHYNVQRRPTQQETATTLLKIAEIEEARGVPIANICSQISELVPYSEQHIRRLLPNKYKHGEMKREINDRLITPYGENIFRVSAKFQTSRKDGFFVIKNGDYYPTLKRRSWFYHEDGREFSLREYARVQEFPNSFIFVGSTEAIKNQIGNAVPPLMANYVAKKIPPCNAIDIFAGAGGMSLGFEQASHHIILMVEEAASNLFALRIKE